MSKFNTAKNKPATGRGPIVAERTPSGRTHEGAPGYQRETRSELFLLAVSNMVGEDTFYEPARDRDERYSRLVRTVAVNDPEWMAGFLPWLRDGANMRTASIVGALEAAKGMLDAAIPGARALVASVLRRADEPGEALAYWTSRYGRAIPKPVKRGIADAARRLYNEYALLKYDTASKGYRFADVLDLTHPAASDSRQADVYRWALERRHNRENPVPESLAMVAFNAYLRGRAAEHPDEWLDAANLRKAGLTWEDTLSLLGSRVDKAKLWEALAPTMGYMALLRNLRNMDEAGVSDEVAGAVAARLADPDQVAKSRQFPYRYLAAYEQAPSLRWGPALDKALHASLAHVPTFRGRSLVLVDTSASMTSRTLSARSKITPAKAAAVFGVVLAARGEADLWGFADGVFQHTIGRGASVIREVDRFVARTGEVGHGTNIASSIRATFRKHDRVFVISDMQTMDRGTSTALPESVALYGFNLGGYRHTAYDAGNTNRHEFGGLTDATFRMIPLLEAGRNATWPWLG